MFVFTSVFPFSLLLPISLKAQIYPITCYFTLEGVSASMTSLCAIVPCFSSLQSDAFLPNPNSPNTELTTEGVCGLSMSITSLYYAVVLKVASVRHYSLSHPNPPKLTLVLYSFFVCLFVCFYHGRCFWIAIIYDFILHVLCYVFLFHFYQTFSLPNPVMPHS